MGSQDNRGAPAGSRQRLGDVVVTYLRDNRAGSSGNQAPKIGCLNRADNWGYTYAQNLSAEGLEQTPMSLLVPLLEFNPFRPSANTGLSAGATVAVGGTLG